MMDNLFKIMAIVNIYILTPFLIWGFYEAYPNELFNFWGWGQNAIGVFGYFICLHHMVGKK